MGKAFPCHDVIENDKQIQSAFSSLELHSIDGLVQERRYSSALAT